MASDPFASPKRRITRARQYIDNIESDIRDFLASQPYTQAVETNAQRLEEHKIKLTKPIPDEITDLAYEAIEALRSALDQSLYPIAVRCGAKRPDLIHFPVADTPAELDNVLRGRIKDFPADILSLLRGFNAHDGGNTLIWALNRIRRQGYHRLIVPVVTVSRAFYESITISSPHFCDLPPLEWDSAKNEVVFARTNPGSNLDYKIDIALFITFGDVEGIAGEPVLETLRETAAEVTSIVSAIETEARRLGLLR